MSIVFVKTGKEIKEAVVNRRRQLEARLEARNRVLDEFLQEIEKVRSYMIRSTQPIYSHGSRGYVLYTDTDVSSEERQEVDQLCQRIFEIEQELHRLALISRHLDDEQVFQLDFSNLIGYGFDVGLETGGI